MKSKSNFSNEFFSLSSSYRQAQVVPYQRRAAIPRRFQEVHEVRGVPVRAVSFLPRLQSHPLHTAALQLRSSLVRPAVLSQTETRASRDGAGVQKVQADQRRRWYPTARLLAAGRSQHAEPLPEPERRELERGPRLAVVLLSGRFVSKWQRPSDGSHRANDHGHRHWELFHGDHRAATPAAESTESTAHCHGTSVSGTCDG